MGVWSLRILMPSYMYFEEIVPDLTDMPELSTPLLLLPSQCAFSILILGKALFFFLSLHFGRDLLLAYAYVEATISLKVP